MGIDLLVFGPHPDDIEIGLGGAVAHHVALGLTIGLCDLTAGEMGSNGTVINDAAAPSFVIDVSSHYERKRQALDCYASQFQTTPNTVATRLNTPLFHQLVESRDAQFGALAGVAWAEGIVVREPLVRPTLLRTAPPE